MSSWLDKKEDAKAKTLTEQFLSEDAPWFFVGANVPMIIDKMSQDLDSYPPSLEAVQTTVDSLSGKLLINAKYADAWRDFCNSFPQYEMDANRNIAFTSLQTGELPSWDAFAAMAQQGMFVINREARELEEAERERDRMIAEITNGGKSGFYLRTPNGGKRVYDSNGEEIQYSSAGGRRQSNSDDGFAAMSDEDIRVIYDQVVAQRKLAAMTPQQLRATINPIRKQQFERSSVSLQSKADYVLTNPETNREFTKVELIKFLNGGKGNATRILVHQSSKQIIPAAVARMKEILGVSR